MERVDAVLSCCSPKVREQIIDLANLLKVPRSWVVANCLAFAVSDDARKGLASRLVDGLRDLPARRS